jgi:hypothetical protein
MLTAASGFSPRAPTMMMSAVTMPNCISCMAISGADTFSRARASLIHGISEVLRSVTGFVVISLLIQSFS